MSDQADDRKNKEARASKGADAFDSAIQRPVFPKPDPPGEDIRMTEASSDEDIDRTCTAHDVSEIAETIRSNKPESGVIRLNEATRDAERMAEIIEKNWTRTTSTAKIVGDGGGQLTLLGCTAFFPKTTFKNTVPVSIVVVVRGDCPDGLRLISPLVTINAWGVVLQHNATMKLPVYYRNVGPAAIIMCKTTSESKWKKLECDYLEDNGFLSFQISHFGTFGVFTKGGEITRKEKTMENDGSPNTMATQRETNIRFSPNTMATQRETVTCEEITMKNHLFFKPSAAALEIIGLTCIADEATAQGCIDFYEKEGFKNGKLESDCIWLAEEEKMEYGLDVVYPTNTSVVPQNVEHNVRLISTNKFQKVNFKLDPNPAPHLDHAVVNYTLRSPKKKTNSLVLEWGAPTDEDPADTVSKLCVRGATKEAKSAHLGNKNTYQFYPDRCKGSVLIINNNFEGNEDLYREGSDVDVRNMTTLWAALGFRVVPTLNLTAQEMLDSCRKFAADTGDVSMVVVVIMSHGGKSQYGNEFFLGKDGQKLSVEKVTTVFTSERSRHLDGIPKVFLFQACRVSAQVFARDDVDAQVMEEEHPPKRDMLIAFATQSGYGAIRNTLNGSWFINAITHVFMNNAHDQDVQVMLTSVNDAVAKRSTNDCRVQISNQEYYLRKTLKLYPV